MHGQEAFDVLFAVDIHSLVQLTMSKARHIWYTTSTYGFARVKGVKGRIIARLRYAFRLSLNLPV